MGGKGEGVGIVGGEERRGSKCFLGVTRNITHIWKMNLEEGGY